MTASPTAPKIYEIFDISYSHMADLEEEIWNSDNEEKLCCTSKQTFSSDSPLNSMQKFPMTALENEEEFDFSPYNVAAGVKICDNLDILEEISY